MVKKSKHDFSRWEEIKTWVIDKLHDRSVNNRQVADDAKVSYWWLMLLKRGRIPEPGFSRLGRLYQALGGRPPKIPATSQEIKDGSGIPSN